MPTIEDAIQEELQKIQKSLGNLYELFKQLSEKK